VTLIVSRESKVTGAGGKGCSSCGGARDRKNQRYCKKCHRAYMQKWRSGKVAVLLSPDDWQRVQGLLAGLNR